MLGMTDLFSATSFGLALTDESRSIVGLISQSCITHEPSHIKIMRYLIQIAPHTTPSHSKS